MKIKKERMKKLMEKLDKRTIEYKTLVGMEYIENNLDNSFTYVMGYRDGNSDAMQGIVDEPDEMYLDLCYSMYKFQKKLTRSNNE